MHGLTKTNNETHKQTNKNILFGLEVHNPQCISQAHLQLSGHHFVHQGNGTPTPH